MSEKTNESESGFFKTEDQWAIWLGFLIIAVGMMIYLPKPPEGMDETIAKSNAVMDSKDIADVPFHTIAWHNASAAKAKIKATSLDHTKEAQKFIAAPHGWKSNPIDAFILNGAKYDEKHNAAEEKYQAAQKTTADLLAQATIDEEEARKAGFKDQSLNEKAELSIMAWRNGKYVESKAKKKAVAGPHNQVFRLIGFCAALALLFALGIFFMRQSPLKFIIAFPCVFLIAVLAYLMAAQTTMKLYGIGYAAWAIVFGLLISNTIGTPQWIKSAVRTEYYIKTGLVLLGAEILLGKILLIGIPGIFVAWIVTPIVLVTTYLFGQHVLKIPSKTLNITISADMSVCGVSAAIAVAAACKAKKEELTLAVGMSLVFTSIMMILMPTFISWVGMPVILGGAWIGGTVDATGAVAAAGEFLGDQALYVAATIKMIQNVLIGVVAFCVAIYWCAVVEKTGDSNVSAIEIWRRFPKFVIGFVLASIVFSVLYQAIGADAGYALIDNGVIKGFTKTFRGWFFCLAFVSIGLDTNFRDLKKFFKGGKPLILYVCGQSLNLALTLIMAYIMFYKVFPEITDKI